MTTNEQRQLLSLEDWKSSVKDGDTPANIMLYKYAVDTAIKVVGEPKDRKLGFVISTEARDRQSDTIALDGWELADFRKNPVVLWAHSHRDLPVARAPEVGVDSDALRSVAQFPTREVHPFGDTVFQLLLGKFLNASSVGFDPKKFIINDEERGFDFIKQDLLEWSIVPVPANAEALQDASAAGINLQPIVHWAERALDEWQEEGAVLVLPRAQIERAYKISSGRLAFVVPADIREMPEGLELVEAFDDNLAPPAAAGADAGIAVQVTLYDEHGTEVGKYTPAIGSSGTDNGAGGSFEFVPLPTPTPTRVYTTIEEVAEAAARSVDGDTDGLRAELTAAYNQFQALPPWERDTDAWAAYAAGAKLAQRRSYATPEAADVALASMLLDLGFALEASTLAPPVTPEAEFAVALDAEYGLGVTPGTDAIDDDMGALFERATDADLADLATALAEPIRNAARSAMTQFTGRLD